MRKNAIKRQRMDKGAIIMLCSFFIPLGITGFIWFNGATLGTFIQMFQKEIPGQEAIWSLDNFTRIFREGFSGPNAVFRESLVNSLLFFILAAFIMLPINVIVAYFIYKKIFAYKAFRILFYLPNVMPSVILAMLFKYITAPDGAGVLASLFYKMGMEFPNIFGDSRYAIWGLLFFSFWSGFGAGFLIYGAGMKRIPPEIIEAAALDGITWFKEIIYIIVPLIFPTLAMAFISLVPTIFTSSGAVLFFTQGDYGTYTISYWLFEQVYGRSNLNYSSAVSLFFQLLTLPLALGTYWLLQRVPDVEY